MLYSSGSRHKFAPNVGFHWGAQMSENNDKFNVFDPTGMMKTMRDASMDNWAKMMTSWSIAMPMRKQMPRCSTPG